MRYTAEHKEQSRARILEAARELFRRNGFDGASIDEVTRAAGLTRGAFYAHFGSKDDLTRQVLGIEAGLVRGLQSAAASDDPDTAAREALTKYLDPAARDDVASGCPLVAHPIDAIRGDAGLKRGYTDRLEALIESVAAVTDGDSADDDAMLISVLAIGGAMLSAASADPELGNRIERVYLGAIGDAAGWGATE